MKELLTKRFWQDVKKTFQEAREGAPPKDNAAQIRAADKSDVPSTTDAPLSSSTSDSE
jgi:hypothetical protein